MRPDVRRSEEGTTWDRGAAALRTCFDELPKSISACDSGRGLCPAKSRRPIISSA
jgi:hypothetical protein